LLGTDKRQCHAQQIQRYTHRNGSSNHIGGLDASRWFLEQSAIGNWFMRIYLVTVASLLPNRRLQVHGAAFAGGMGLAAACDIAIASADTRFCLSEVKLGLIPAMISPYVIEAMGERQARRYFLSAEVFEAAKPGASD
jgi:hypothetical protein